MGMIFTTQQVKGLKAKATDKRQEFRDEGAPNLFIVVQPRSGETSFVFRPTINGKQRRVTIGHFPYMSLAEARSEVWRLKGAILDGRPLKRLAENSSSSGLTVKEAWDLYWKHEASSRQSADEKQRIFDKDVAPSIGQMALTEVTREELARLVSEKFAKAKTASNRLHSLLARFFKWCFTHGHAFTKLESNPMDGVAKMHSERDAARKRYLTEEELGWWFEALPAAGDFAPIHELLMRTLCRYSDIFNLTWAEVIRRDTGDLVLEIGRTKNDQPHLVYLHPSAATLIPEQPIGAKSDDRVFSLSSRSNKPVERIRRRMEELAGKRGGKVAHWQPHDYRRTGVTHLAAMLDAHDGPLVPDHVLDRLLAHKEQRVIRHYNIYTYYREKKFALTYWNSFLNNLATTTK